MDWLDTAVRNISKMQTLTLYALGLISAICLSIALIKIAFGSIRGRKPEANQHTLNSILVLVIVFIAVTLLNK